MFTYIFLFSEVRPSQQIDSLTMRNASMYMVFQETLFDVLQDVQKEDESSDGTDFCQWMGITCQGDEISAFRFSGIKLGNFRLGYLPNTIKAINISDCNQTFRIDTRSFPTNLTNVLLYGNAIRGTPSLQHLPQHIEEVDFTHNQLSGPISLVDLPRPLRILRLQANRIQQERVWFHNLPEGIRISLPRYRKPEGIKYAEAIDPSMDTDSQSILFV